MRRDDGQDGDRQDGRCDGGRGDGRDDRLDGEREDGREGSREGGPDTGALATRLQRIDAAALHTGLDAQGWCVWRGLLSPGQCDGIASMYGHGKGFRSQVVMARHGFGRGEYRYFAYPLPPLVQQLRTALYPLLVPIANEWHERMGMDVRFPATHAGFIARCAAAGQVRPTPLLLQYGAGDYNCLHQDLYGEHVFPLQVAVLLSAPGTDFSGGEFVLTEQRPRMQTRASVVPLAQGDAVVFAVNSRPVRGTRGDYRVKLRHGVSTITAGHRHTLGIIFHDAT
jgi:hypothetical protein